MKIFGKEYTGKPLYSQDGPITEPITVRAVYCGTCNRHMYMERKNKNRWESTASGADSADWKFCQHCGAEL